MVFCDNQSIVHLTNDWMFHERTKHIDIQYHFVCDVIFKGNVFVKKINTEANPADMLTKPLSSSHCKVQVLLKDNFNLLLVCFFSLF